VVKNETEGLKDASGVLLDEKTMRLIVGASNVLVQAFAKEWEIGTPSIVMESDVKDPKDTDWQFRMVYIDPEEPGAAAYHYDDVSRADGVVLAKTILDGGGYVLFDPKLGKEVPLDGKEYFVRGASSSTIAAAFFHEVGEALMNASVNGYWESPTPLAILHGGRTKKTFSSSTFLDGSTLVASEACDPVQQNFVVMGYQGKTVALSDFILPNWRDTNDPGPYNYADTLQHAFTVDIGGYAVILDRKGNWKQVFSTAIPADVLRRKTRWRRGKHAKVQWPQKTPQEPPQEPPQKKRKQAADKEE
jgi:hypothetical protein